MKCREFQYWDSLQFDDQGHVLPMTFQENVHLDVDVEAVIRD